MKKKFICTVCGYVYEGDAAPEQCPVCKAPASKFKELVEGEEEDFEQSMSLAQHAKRMPTQR